MAESEEIEIPIEFDPRKGLELMIDLIGFKRVVEEFGLQRVVEEFGLQRVVEEFGLQRVVEELSDEQKNELRKLLTK